MDNDFFNKLSRIKRSKNNKITRKEEVMTSILKRIDSVFNTDECDCLNDLVRCQKLVIHFSKELDFAQASEMVELSKSILKLLQGDSLILGKIFLYPSLAYYAKKNNNLGLAKRYINQTIKLDDFFTPVFPVLHIHKLHHILNLHQLLLRQQEYRKCATLFVDVFMYLYTYELAPNYGLSGKNYLNKVQSEVTLTEIMGNFAEVYFMCIWENPIVEKFFLKNKKIKNIINDTDHVNECVNAFKDFNVLQTMFSERKIDSDLFFTFFNKYDLYIYDTYRLLLLKNLFYISESTESQNLILNEIRNKLNFKFPDKLIESIRNPSMK